MNDTLIKPLSLAALCGLGTLLSGLSAAAGMPQAPAWWSGAPTAVAAVPGHYRFRPLGPAAVNRRPPSIRPMVAGGQGRTVSPWRPVAVAPMPRFRPLPRFAARPMRRQSWSGYRFRPVHLSTARGVIPGRAPRHQQGWMRQRPVATVSPRGVRQGWVPVRLPLHAAPRVAAWPSPAMPVPGYRFRPFHRPSGMAPPRLAGMPAVRGPARVAPVLRPYAGPMLPPAWRRSGPLQPARLAAVPGHYRFRPLPIAQRPPVRWAPAALARNWQRPGGVTVYRFRPDPRFAARPATPGPAGAIAPPADGYRFRPWTAASEMPQQNGQEGSFAPLIAQGNGFEPLAAGVPLVAESHLTD